MHRRQFNQAGASVPGAFFLAAYQQAYALSMGDLNGVSHAEASAGLKVALEKCAIAAVALLGRPDGFLGNPKVRIPLPGYLEDMSRLLKNVGQGQRMEALVTIHQPRRRSRCAHGQGFTRERRAQHECRRRKKILMGGETSVTRFFADNTREPMGMRFFPVVIRATEKLDIANQYNQFAAKAASFGLVKKGDANIEQYVTGRSLDGPYTIIGEEERKIRQNPVGSGSAILGKVFGALK